jgi:hypothetical protein
MILLADPHPLIVQETAYRFDAATRAKSQTSAPLRDTAHNQIVSVVID